MLRLVLDTNVVLDLLHFDDAEDAAQYDCEPGDYICRSCAGWTTDTTDSESPLW